MTTAAEVKAIVRPLLDRNPDLALVGRWLYLKPVQHFARAVLIDRTAYKERFNPQWAVIHLFELRTSFTLSWGSWLVNRRSSLPGIWRTFDPDVQLSLIEAVEEQALPILREIKTLDEYINLVRNNTFYHQLFEWPHCRIIYDIAIGDLENARKIRDDNIEYWSTEHTQFDEQDKALHRRLRELCARLALDDRAGLVQLLRQWEAESVRNLKIAHLWRPTPFPIEELF
ncbi:hypothetical protein ABLE91_27310 [Aquabacter sp. CN5-332]|uniref:hypothetical protein n=1 Tax=Aquabacter sp. CN5-332 TaxID=3156608 RepID=UPI0032B388E4